MADYEFTILGRLLTALADGGLWSAADRTLVVSDLHLGKAERIARREGRLTPPYETAETLTRLAALIDRLAPEEVVCLGDSFDDEEAAAALEDGARATLTGLMAGRRWVWILGNHDPALAGFGGVYRTEHRLGPLVLRHQAAHGAEGEISGHYHPKVWLRGRGRAAFLVGGGRVVLPAFGTYTGGLDVTDPAFDPLFGRDALALMTGRRIVAAPRAKLPVRRRLGAAI